ncbi:MAG: heme-binding domain-containing protein [Chlorobiaceae bacterium]
MTFSFKSFISWAFLLIMLMQFIPLNRINPPIVSDIHAPDLVKKGLKRSCYDCHSNETRWPDFAYIAPASWLASNIVASGRTALNFSAWNHKKLAKIRKVISDMPAHQQLYYLWKPDAQLTVTETRALLEWTN